MPRVIHFEIGADEPERAGKFYRDVFGWEINKWEGPMDYWLVVTGPNEQPGINGAITERMSNIPVINTVDVPSVDDHVDKITAAGGRVVKDKVAILGVGYFAYCADTEGNLFGVMEVDESAQ